MAITGISAISGEQIIAAGAVSAKEAGKASFTTGGNDIQNLYDTVSTNSASWTGGGASYTGDAQGALDEVYGKSANWNTAYGTLSTKSAFWDASYNSILLNSADWARDYTGGKNIMVSGGGLHATISTTDNISVTGDIAISNNSETYLGSITSEDWGGCETPINSITDHYRLEFKNLSPTTGLSISVEDSEDWEQNYTVSNLATADLQDFAITSLSSVAGASVSTAGTWSDLSTLLANGKVNVISTDSTYSCSAWRIDSTNVSLSGLNDFVSTNSASWTASGPSYTGDAQGALDEVYSKSANWDGSYDTLTANSANWTSTNNTVSQRSANWNKAYTAVNNNSAAWGGQALPISAGPGVKMDVVNDTLVFSNDETVLYDSSAKWTGITFSEPASSFERIRLIIGAARPTTFEYPSYAFTNNTWPGGQIGAGWGGKPAMTVFELSANSNGFNVNGGWHTESTASVNWSTLNVSSTWIRPIKVWGINRTASN